jgi:ABC-type transport system substrate-binding protein
MLLAACGGGAAPEAPAVEAPAATEAPMATEAPAVEPEATEAPIPDVSIATFDGTTLSVTECGNGYIGLIKSIEANDATTVTFTLCQPDPAFLSKMAFTPFAIYPSEWLEATAGETNRTSEGLEKPIGTGPYMVSEWNRGDSLTFTAFPDYWGEEPYADTVVLRWSTESAQRLLELQSGTVDGIDNVGPADFETVTADPNLQLTVRPALNIFYVGFNNKFAPFDNVLVRQALALGIDRQRIVDNFYPAGSEVASHFTPCAIPNGCDGDPWYEFDVEAAKAKLAEAGFPDGFKTTLTYRDVVRGYLPQAGVVAQDIQAQLKENLNIDAEIVVMESGAFIEEANSGRLAGIHLLGWGADYPHVTNFLDFHFGQANTQFGNSYPEVYGKLQEGSKISDPVVAKPIYVEANNAIRELVPMIPVAHGGNATAYLADVVNPQASPLTAESFALSDPGGRDAFVFMQNAEPISLFCGDETDGESLRGCDQVMQGLYGYKINDTAVEPVLAESCEPNEDLTVWVCTLRTGIKFHDGTDFDSADVLATYNALFNIDAPTHKGNTNIFNYPDYLFGLMKKPGG